MNGKENCLRAGFGAAPMIFGQSYFDTFQTDGSIGHLDGFNGKVHSFDCGGVILKDNLYTRVMLIEDGEPAAVVSLEIAQAPADQVAYTKDIVSSICGIKKENIWVHVTHQFGFMHRMGDPEKAAVYDDVMKKAVKEAARAALADLRPARTGYGTGECRVSANKNIINPAAPGEGPYYGPGSTLETDPEMTVIRFDCAETGNPIGFYLSYGTKPSALCTTGKDAGTREVNTEVAGQACKWMEQHFKVPCVFCMPAAGDQYPRETAQYFGFDEEGVWRKIDIGFEKGIEIVDRLGAEMGRDAIRIAGQIGTGCCSAPVSVYETAFSYPNKSGDGEIRIPVSVLILGETAFVGFRQEMDCVTGQQIKAGSPYPVTLLVSFLNGDGKYFGHLEAYDFNGGAGTWETARSAFAPGAAEKFVETAVAFLEDIKSGKGSSRWKTDSGTAAPSKTADYFSRRQFGGVEWYVLDKKDGKELLFSRDILEQRHYHRPGEAVSWENSCVRQYLNSEFLSRFTLKEQSQIVSVINENRANPRYAVSGGAKTADKVFLLSLDEAELYLGGFADILCGKTADSGRSSWWLLRSPGEAADVPACVTAAGVIDYHGNAETKEAGQAGIRPCMWVRS